MIRVVLADDQAVVRAGLRALLERSDDIQVVAEAADGAQAVALAAAERPDVLLMDIRMPGLDGVEAARRIACDEQLGGVRVVMLTTFDTDANVFEALRAGAAGFLVKDIGPDELRQAVRVVAGGEGLLSPTVTRRVIEAAVRAHPAGHRHERLAELTEREREVLALVGQGKSNQEIGDELYISPATARTYVSRLLSKLDARDRAQLVVAAYQGGLVGRG
ncbi:MAG: response regulator transcription factor [Candidatus Dormibacteraeota bacterium]|nr:response regulator transcription factor [Candidatus Dormibacteraeota bacterium]